MKIKYKKLLIRIIPFLSCLVLILPFVLLPVAAASQRINYTKVNYWRINLENTGSYYYNRYTNVQTRWYGDEEIYSVNLKWGGVYNWWYLSNRIANTNLSNTNKPWFYQNVYHPYILGSPFGTVNGISDYNTGLSVENILMSSGNTVRPQLKSGQRYTLQFTYNVEFPSSNTLGKKDIIFRIGDVWDIDKDQNYGIIQPGLQWVLYDEYKPDDTSGTVYYDFTAPADINIDVIPLWFDYGAEPPDAPFTASGLKNQVRISFSHFVISEYLFVDPVAGVNSQISSDSGQLNENIDSTFDDIYTDSGSYVDDWLAPITIADMYPMRETWIYFIDLFNGISSSMHMSILLRIGLSVGLLGVIVGVFASIASRTNFRNRGQARSTVNSARFERSMAQRERHHMQRMHYFHNKGGGNK